MEPKYISDIIGFEDIATWKNGERILITAGTGTGKSYFVRTSLFHFAKKRRKKILWLTNRSILREQVRSYLTEEQEEVITVMNYQAVQERVTRTGWQLIRLFSAYDYVVYDEAHYPFADAGFNRKTDLILQPLTDNVMRNVIIFITATPQQVLLFQDKYDHSYRIPYKFDHVRNIYFYSRKETFEAILQSIPREEKAIYFANRIKDAVSVSDEYGDEAKFICSVSNEYSKHISKKAVEEIREKSKFSGNLLCTTRVLDNGIDIKDEAVRHIIIDISDPVEFIQCIGRKRVVNKTDYVDLYIERKTDFDLNGYINRLQSPLYLLDELERIGKEAFLERYKQEELDSIVHNDITVNRSKVVMLEYLIGAYQKMLSVGFEKYIMGILGIPVELISDADEKFHIMSIEEMMQEHVGVKLFTSDKNYFKERFFVAAFNPKKKKVKRNRGINTINGILEDAHLPYVVSSKRETNGENRNRHYWIVEPKLTHESS